jgi:peptidoglycan/LPS O-acetylase OafA/YrhL
MFFIGAAFYIFRNHIFISSRIFLIILLVLSLSVINKDLFFVVYSISIPYLVFYIAYVPAGKIREYNRIGDYSYGMYIYAFPVQQSVAAILPGISVAWMVVISFGITLLLALLSWHLIEKNFLQMKGHYVAIEKILRIPKLN